MIRVTVRHNGKSLDGVRTAAGLVWLRPGQTREGLVLANKRQVQLLARKTHLEIIDEDGDLDDATPVTVTNDIPPVSPDLEKMDRDGLIAFLEERGVDVNRRLGEDNLRKIAKNTMSEDE